MTSTQFWVGALVPSFIKWANPYLKKLFKLSEFDTQIQGRVTSKQYPSYFGVLYGFWIITILGSGVAVLLLMMVYGSSLFPGKSFAALTFVGLINMIGAWFVLGALLNILFWQISSNNFRDYVKFRQIKSGWNYEINQQIATLLKIGLVYYLITFPLQAYLIYF